MSTLDKVINFFKGKFGKYHLIYPYRFIWSSLWTVVIIWITFKIMFLFFAWWDGVVMGLNHMIWTR